MQHRSIFLCLLASTSTALDVVFNNGRECSGEPLFGTTQINSDVECFDISDHDAFDSVTLSDFRGQAIRFFTDTQCEHQIHVAQSDSCFTPSGIPIAAIAIGPSESHMQAETASKEMVPYNLAMTDYAANSLSPNLRYTAYYLGVAGLAVTSAVSLGNAAIGCYSAATGSAISKYTCISGILSTIVSWIATHVIATADGPDLNVVWQGATGAFNQMMMGSRSVKQIEDINAKYMHTIMANSTWNVVHVGHRTRDLGQGINHSSPVYRIVAGENDDMTWHITAHYQPEKHSFIHHIFPAGPEVTLSKRVMNPGYENVRWSANGIDFESCSYNRGADSSDFSYSPDDLQQTAWNELTCTETGSFYEDALGIRFDVYNGNSVLKNQISLAPYKNGGGHALEQVSRCSSGSGTVNQNCIG